MSKRIDFFLVENGYARSRERAKALVRSGGVSINGKPASKPSDTVCEGDIVTVTAEDHKYVGRGAFKLEKAFECFGLDVSGKVCADIGASTGGFTQILLERGAAIIYAVDVGHGQLDKTLAADERVINCEGVNVKELSQGFFKEPVSFMSVDLSFISLNGVMDILAGCLTDGGEITALIKPQFEAGRQAIGKGGVVKDKRTHVRVLEQLLAYFTSCGLSTAGLTWSPVTGGDGNVEYLAHLKKMLGDPSVFDVKSIVQAAFAELSKGAE